VERTNGIAGWVVEVMCYDSAGQQFSTDLLVNWAVKVVRVQGQQLHIRARGCRATFHVAIEGPEPAFAEVRQIKFMVCDNFLCVFLFEISHRE
jgi:hypothetical protein